MLFFINVTEIYTMSYITDKNDNHILDENGNKIEFNVEYINTNEWYKHRAILILKISI